MTQNQFSPVFSLERTTPPPSISKKEVIFFSYFHTLIYTTLQRTKLGRSFLLTPLHPH